MDLSFCSVCNCQKQRWFRHADGGCAAFITYECIRLNIGSKYFPSRWKHFNSVEYFHSKPDYLPIHGNICDECIDEILNNGDGYLSPQTSPLSDNLMKKLRCDLCDSKMVLDERVIVKSRSSFIYKSSPFTLMACEFPIDERILCIDCLKHKYTYTENNYIECSICNTAFEKICDQLLAHGCSSTIHKKCIYSGYGSKYDYLEIKYTNAKPNRLQLDRKICDVCIDDLIRLNECYLPIDLIK